MSPVDLLDPKLYDDPWATYARLRAAGGLCWDEKNNLWGASRHEDVVHIAKTPELYCSGQGNRPITLAPMSLLSMDDPEHTRQRRFVSRGFTPNRVGALAGRVRRIARDVVDEIAALGTVDFVQQFAVHVPLIVIAELLGFDLQSRMKLYKWSDDMVAAEGRTFEDPRIGPATEAFHAFVTLCGELIERRRVDPKDDIISVLAARADAGELGKRAHAEGHVDDELVDDELLMFLTILLVGGNETTRNAIAGGLLAFSRFPEEKAKLLANPKLLDAAVEEIVRFTSPAMAHSRTVTRDHDFNGQTLREGDKVLLLWQSANRDERVFEQPERFRIDRDPNPHVAFGVGTHFCLGANLARLELSIAFEELFRRLPDIHVPAGEEPTRDAQTMMLAYEHLRAVFTPAA